MTGAGGLFHDAMELQSRTLFGILSNIKDSFIVIGEDLGRHILPQAKAIADAFKEWVGGEGLVTVISHGKNFLESMGTLIKGGFSIFKMFGFDNKAAMLAAGSALLLFFMPTTFAVTGLFLALQDLANFIDGRGSVIGNFFKLFEGGIGQGLKDILVGFAMKPTGDEKRDREARRVGSPFKAMFEDTDRLGVLNKIRRGVHGGPTGIVPDPSSIAPSGGSSSSTGDTNSTLEQNIKIDGSLDPQASADAIFKLSEDLLKMQNNMVKPRRAM